MQWMCVRDTERENKVSVVTVMFFDIWIYHLPIHVSVAVYNLACDVMFPDIRTDTDVCVCVCVCV